MNTTKARLDTSLYVVIVIVLAVINEQDTTHTYTGRFLSALFRF